MCVCVCVCVCVSPVFTGDGCAFLSSCLLKVLDLCKLHGGLKAHDGGKPTAERRDGNLVPSLLVVPNVAARGGLTSPRADFHNIAR